MFDHFSTVSCASFRKFKTVDAAKGHGLCLLDFGRAVDLTAFSDEIKFLGSCGTEGFQCAQMLEGKPWKYEVLHMYILNL